MMRVKRYKRFLVRFSSNTKEGNADSKSSARVKYTVTSCDTSEQSMNGKFSHQRLSNIDSSDQLIKWVDDHYIKAGWKPVKGARKYAACFTKYTQGGGAYRNLDPVPFPTPGDPVVSFGVGQCPWDESLAKIIYVH
eukprot:TRINITY_DN3169_c0_g4_i3.p1 TRINITY_DN3169_c0_g4~~TRINITY_DN3169_c0_g4_i3.p1  ORF type:complete len:136 (+),score=21.04 TRINITY_DN3169_c0_g4_i3:321-728(+)